MMSGVEVDKFMNILNIFCRKTYCLIDDVIIKHCFYYSIDLFLTIVYLVDAEKTSELC